MNHHSPLPLRVTSMCVGLLLALFLPFCGVQASMSELPELALEHHASPSGEWVLSVDPSTRLGSGSARYTMRHRGRIAWQATHPFTLWEVAVADDGRSGGAGYDTGLTGGPRAPGKFIVAVFDAAGQMAPTFAIARRESRFLHDFPHPRANGVWIDAARDEWVVRVADPDMNVRDEHWWRFTLDDGQRLREDTPARPVLDSGQLLSIVRAIAVADTPLTLVQWLRSDAGADKSGAPSFGSQFALLDAQNQVVWTHALAGDVAEGAYTNHWDLAVRMRGLRSNVSGTFSVQSLARNRWLNFRMTADATSDSGWRVEAQGDSVVDAHDHPLLARFRGDDTHLRNLKRLGELDLLAASKTPKRAEILGFDSDAQGRIGQVARTECDCAHPTFHWTLHDTDGHVAASVPLDVLNMRNQDDLATVALADGRWLVVASSPTGKPNARAAMVSPEAKEPTLLPYFEAQQIEVLAATRDGGFVALQLIQERYTSKDVLSRHDAQGRRLWQIDEDYNDDTRLFSPEDIAVLTNGDIVVLENVSKKIKRYDDGGRHLRTLDLSTAWGREPNYPTALVATPGGGFLVHDFGGKPQFVRMDADGQVLSSFEQATYADHRSFHAFDLAFAPNGDLWASDGRALLQLDTDGRVVADLGDAPDATRLTEIATVAVMPDGQILAMDDRTHAVHRFDADGLLRQVLTPDASDYDGEWLIPWLVMDAEGQVRAARSRASHVRYDREGRRVSAEPFQDHAEPDNVLPHPKPNRLWWIDRDEVALVTARGQALRRHERDAHGRWLSMLTAAGVAPDGSLAVLGDDDGRPTVTLFSPNGELQTTWPAPVTAMTYASSLGFDGKTLLLLTEEMLESEPQRAIFAFDRSGQALFQFLPDEQQPWWGAFHVRVNGHSELWIGSDPGQLQRYAWPD